MNELPSATAPAPPAKTPRDARLGREAAALRENLRRRKQQARIRAEPSVTAPAPGIERAPSGSD